MAALPRVISHIGMSLDSRLDYPGVDEGLYYELVATVFADHDAVLSGSNTVLAAYAGRELPAETAAAFTPRPRDPDDQRPLLVVVDSQGRLRHWHAIREEPYWQDPVVLVSEATPQAYLDYLAERHLDYIRLGEHKVDLKAALAALRARYNVGTLRVDSGGILNGVLLRLGLVDEVSLLVSPRLVGGTSPHTMCPAPDLASDAGVVRLKLLHTERLRDDILWLRYEVIR